MVVINKIMSIFVALKFTLISDMKKLSRILCSISILACASASFAEAPAGYYSSCEGAGGQTLLTRLADVVGNHTTVSYDGLWKVYETSDIDAEGKLWDMYSTKRWTIGQEKCGNYKVVGDCVNREHSFPKSWFDDRSPMVSDAFHIYPTDGKVNGQRSNYPYGECAGGTTLPSNGNVKALGRLGASTFPGYSGTVFEPVDEYKGDFARSYFYMAAAYNSRISTWSSDMLAGNSYPAFSGWAINLLLKWHRQDPVSEKEIARNDAVYAHQKNRNPFIDHPELVEYVWGNKTAEKWYVNGTPTPAIALPVDNSTVDFGLAPANYTLSRSISVKAQNLSSPLAISISSADFTASVASVKADDANRGTSFSITLKAASAGTKNAVLTLSDGSVTARVNLVAEVIDGIPALPASDIDTDAFTANWISLGDAEQYMLDVMKEGTSIQGYPRAVNAETEEFRVGGLEESTAYTYRLSSDAHTSNTVAVTTVTPVPVIQYLGSETIELNSQPGTPSDPAEIWIYAENIDSDISVTVESPFEVSVNHTDWSRSVTLSAGEDRFFLRVNAAESGEYTSFIVLQAGSYINDNAMAIATVRDNSEPWFIEDFELAGAEGHKYDSYDAGYYSGKVVEWTLGNAGIWKSDTDKNGVYSLRLGKTSASFLSTKTPKKSGIGTVSFNACRWSASDGNMELHVEYSADGTNWTDAGAVTVDADQLHNYSVEVKAEGTLYLRIRQSAGARGNIDDITVTDHIVSSVDDDEILMSTWTAYSVGESLVIENAGPARRFMIYNIEGMEMFSAEVGTSASVSLPAGYYIVTDLDSARRVIVK